MWLPSDGFCEASEADRRTVREAIWASQLAYGRDGQVSVDAGLLERLVDAAEDHEACLENDAEEKVSALQRAVLELMAIVKATMFTKALPAALLADAEQVLEEAGDLSPDGDDEAELDRLVNKHVQEIQDQRDLIAAEKGSR